MLPTTLRQIAGNAVAIAGILAALRMRNRGFAWTTIIGAFTLAIQIGEPAERADHGGRRG